MKDKYRVLYFRYIDGEQLQNWLNQKYKEGLRFVSSNGNYYTFEIMEG